MTPNQKGDLGEAKVAVRLMELGFTVSSPWGDAEYDLVAEKNGDFYRVQAKYSKAKNGKFEVRRYGVQHGKRKGYTREGVDRFAVYCPDIDGVFFFSPDGPVVETIRIDNPTIVHKTMKFAGDYAGFF